jgi:hypothetical protein
MVQFLPLIWILLIPTLPPPQQGKEEIATASCMGSKEEEQRSRHAD